MAYNFFVGHGANRPLLWATRTVKIMIISLQVTKKTFTSK